MDRESDTPQRANRKQVWWETKSTNIAEYINTNMLFKNMKKTPNILKIWTKDIRADRTIPFMLYVIWESPSPVVANNYIPSCTSVCQFVCACALTVKCPPLVRQSSSNLLKTELARCHICTDVEHGSCIQEYHLCPKRHEYIHPI